MKSTRLLLKLFALVFAIALVAAACGDDESTSAEPTDESAADESEAEEPAEDDATADEPAEDDAAADEPEAEEPADESGFSLEVDGTEYVLPGPPGGILGALPPDEVFLWKYNFETGQFEQDGDEPAPRFDPTPRTATEDWQIGWSNPWAALEFSTLLENSTLRTAEAAGASIVGNCDIEFDPAKALACTETVLQLDPDGAIFPNWQESAAAASMALYDDARVPVVNMDVYHPNAIFFGADNFTSGAISGINTGLYAEETWSCEDVWILLGENLSAGDAPDLRLQGFQQGVQAICDVPDDRVVRIPVDGTTEQGLQATLDWLTGNPDAIHPVAASLDDVVTVPMSRAIEQADREGVASGQGGELNAIERIYEGPAEQTKFLGTTAYFPEFYGDFAVAAMIDILEGKSVPQEIHISHVYLDRDNIAEFYGEDGVLIGDLPS